MTELRICIICKYTLRPFEGLTLQVTPAQITSNPAASHIEPIKVPNCSGFECCKCHSKFLDPDAKVRHASAFQEMQARVMEAVDSSVQTPWE